METRAQALVQELEAIFSDVQSPAAQQRMQEAMLRARAAQDAACTHRSVHLPLASSADALGSREAQRRLSSAQIAETTASNAARGSGTEIEPSAPVDSRGVTESAGARRAHAFH